MYEFFLCLPPLLEFGLQSQCCQFLFISFPALPISADFPIGPWHTVPEMSSGIIQTCLLTFPWIFPMSLQKDSSFIMNCPQKPNSGQNKKKWFLVWKKDLPSDAPTMAFLMTTQHKRSRLSPKTWSHVQSTFL